MFNFTLISKKNFLNFLKKINSILINIFNNFQFNNLKRLTKLFLIDKRFILTLIIVFFSVFVHLSTPAFYKDNWVKEIVKNQFEKEFKFEIELSDKLSYSIFPVPHFNFNNVKLISNEKDLAQIDTVKVYLTFSKFLDKNKMNIQKIVIKKAKFDFHKKDLKNLIGFFKKKINEKKITILKSKIFLKDNLDQVYSIISVDKSQSFFDNLETINKLDINGKIFNNYFSLNLKNDFIEKKSNLDLSFNEINKRFINVINYKAQTKTGSLSYLDARKKFDTFYTFDENILKFNSEAKIDDKFFYSGVLNFSPFSSKVEINLKSISLKNMIKSNSFFLEILRSNIYSNENLNYNIEVKSRNISDHRKLKDLNLNINYENQSLNFNQSNFLLEDILKINLIESEIKNLKNRKYFLGEFQILIQDYSNLYKFFQTKKEFRKKINSINLIIKYDLLKDNLFLEELNIDNRSNKNIRNIIQQFNQDSKAIRNKVDLRNFFNSIIEEL